MKARQLKRGNKFKTARSGDTVFRVAGKVNALGGMVHFLVEGRSDPMWLNANDIVTLVP